MHRFTATVVVTIGLFALATIAGCSEPIGHAGTNDQSIGTYSAAGDGAKAKILVTR